MTVLVAKVQFVCIGVQLTRTTGHDFALNALPQAPYSITAEALNSRSDLGLNVPLKKPPKKQKPQTTQKHRGKGNLPQQTKKTNKKRKYPKELTADHGSHHGHCVLLLKMAHISSDNP